MNKVSILLMFIVFTIAISLQSCSSDDNGTSIFGTENEPAPNQLPIGYVIAKNNEAAYYPLYYWIKDSEEGWHNDSRNMMTNTPIYTSYSYKKMSSNTAFFSFSITQYINGTVTSRNFYYEGILTFDSPETFSYEGSYEYYANGIYQNEYSFSEPSLIFFPEESYRFIATMPR